MCGDRRRRERRKRKFDFNKKTKKNKRENVNDGFWQESVEEGRPGGHLGRLLRASVEVVEVEGGNVDTAEATFLKIALDL